MFPIGCCKRALLLLLLACKLSVWFCLFWPARDGLPLLCCCCCWRCLLTLLFGHLVQCSHSPKGFLQCLPFKVDPFLVEVSLSFIMVLRWLPWLALDGYPATTVVSWVTSRPDPSWPSRCAGGLRGWTATWFSIPNVNYLRQGRIQGGGGCHGHPWSSEGGVRVGGSTI